MKRQELMKKDVIINAILFECMELLDKETGKSANDKKVLNELIDFYMNYHHKFRYEVKTPARYDDENNSMGPTSSRSKLTDMYSWLDENEILYFCEIDHDYTGLVTGIFIFTSKEDATAFKLKWC